MNIYEKISDIMQQVQYLSKDDHVKFNSTNYKALSEEKVTTVMREQMISHKLVVFPIAQTSSRIGSITHVDTVYRMVNCENPEEYIDIASCGDGADTQDKGAGKAMTYAFKYMWLRTFALPTGEDPDKISNEQVEVELAKQAVKEAEHSRQIAEVAMAEKPGWREPPAGDTPVICEACGYRIGDYFDGNSLIKAETMGERSSAKNNGRVLCSNCTKRHK